MDSIHEPVSNAANNVVTPMDSYIDQNSIAVPIVPKDPAKAKSTAK